MRRLMSVVLDLTGKQVELVAGRPLPGGLVLPLHWCGTELSWNNDYEPPGILLGCVRFNDEECALLGYRLELTQSDAEYDGHILAFRVLTSNGDHRLVQTESVTYSEDDEAEDYQMVGDLQALPQGPAPRWKPDIAVWPTVESRPMQFVAQWRVPSVDATRCFTTDEDVFLFAAKNNAGQTRFKVVTQDWTEQSPDEHYELEGELE